MICIGHRGACGHAPENTLLSVRTALDLKVDWVEVDVYAIENQLVVFHDERLERTTNGKGLIHDKTLDYLRSLDAGNGEKIPLLAEVLEVISGAAGINVELKGTGSAALTANLLQAEVVSGRFSSKQILVSSFNHRELYQFKQLVPEIAIGGLVAGIPLSLAAFAEELGAATVNAALDFVSEEFVADTHRRGMSFYVYTVNHADDVQRMANLGVDGVFSDYPEVVLQAAQKDGLP